MGHPQESRYLLTLGVLPERMHAHPPLVTVPIHVKSSTSFHAPFWLAVNEAIFLNTVQAAVVIVYGHNTEIRKTDSQSE